MPEITVAPVFAALFAMAYRESWLGGNRLSQARPGSGAGKAR